MSDDGTTVTIMLKKTATVVDPTVGYPVMITAKDDTQGIMFTQTLRVVRNAAPTLATTVAFSNLLIGALAVETPEDSAWPGGDIFTCAMLNSCEFTPIVTDANHDDASTANFHDFGDLTYEAVSSDPTKVAATGGDKIKIVGMASTAVTTDGTTSNTFAAEGVTITVTAVDGGGVKSEPKSFMVIVNAPPMRNNTPVPSYTITKPGSTGVDGGQKTLNVSLLITDPDTAAGDLVYSIRITMAFTRM